MIIYASENFSIREPLENFLISHNVSKNLRICDVGGSFGHHFNRITTDIIDINPPLDFRNYSKKEFHFGDINNSSTWEKIPDKYFDFIICSHTLEDIRDPSFVISQLTRTSKAGYISVPNRFTEMSHIESMFWRGYCHHRWIFHFTKNNLSAIAKFPPFSARVSIKDIFRFYKLKFIKKFFKRIQMNKPLGYIPIKLKENSALTLKAGKSGHDIELSLICVGSLPFSYVNNDFAGKNQKELIKIGSDFINQEFDSRVSDLNICFEKLESFLRQG